MANELAVLHSSNTVATYDKVADPIKFSNEIARSVELLCGAPAGSGAAIGMLMLCEGLTVMEVSQRYHFIQGRPSKRADAMLAEFRMNHGGDYEVVERSPERAAIKFTDARGRTYEREFTLEQLNDSRWPWVNWKDHTKGYKDNYGTPKDRETMLFSRLVSDSLRFICPELVAGVYTPEEVADMGPVVEQAPKPAPPTIADHLAKASKAPVRRDTIVIDDVTPVDDAIDASFEVVSETTAEHSADEAPPEDPSAPGSIRRRQGEKIRQLFGTLGMNEEQQRSALAKRQASVINNLSSDDAASLIDRLEAKARELNLVGDPVGE